MNNKTIIEFGFRIIWRIMEISEGVIRLGLHENRGYFPEKRNAFVLDDQDGRSDVTCKPEV